MMSPMKVKAVAPWFGGKRTLAPQVVTQLGKHTQYFEPCCGSAAVLFAKEPSQKETISDLHRQVTNLLWCVADPAIAPRLYERLLHVPFSQELLKEAQSRIEEHPHVRAELLEGCATDADIELAYWYFLASWMGRNGTSGTARDDYQLAVRWSPGGGSPTVRWKNAVDSLPAWHRRLLNVVILQRDLFEWLDRPVDDPTTAIYVDPPYVMDGKTRTGAQSKSNHTSRYKHDFENVDRSPTLFENEATCKHEKLRDILGTFEKARVVVSYYDCDYVRELYDGWTFVKLSAIKNLYNVHKGSGQKEVPEVLIINGPSMEASA